MHKRTAHTTRSPFAVSPATLRQFVVESGEYHIEHLENLVDSMVTGDMPRRHILLVGPLASGKRALSRAIASEFCTNVVEIDPSGPCREDDLSTVLRDLKDGDILVVHNMDEFPAPTAVTLWRAIVTGKVSESAGQYRDSCDAIESRTMRRSQAAEALEPLADFTVVATTNAWQGIPAPVQQNMLRFNLGRSLAGTKAAIVRTLSAHGLSCSLEACELLASVFVAAIDDIFTDTMSLAVAACRRSGAESIEIGLAQRIASSAWSLMPDGRAAESLKKAAESERVASDEMCNRLCVPAAIARNLKPQCEKPKNPRKLAELLEESCDEE
jgi:hypothetical protein